MKSLKAVYIAGGVVGGLSLLLALFGGGVLSFDHFQDENFLTQYFKGNQAQYDQFIDALKEGREQFMKSSAFQILWFCARCSLILVGIISNKLKKEYVVAAHRLLIVLTWLTVDQQYLNEKKFISKKKQERPFAMRPVDQQIYQLETNGGAITGCSTFR